MLSSKWIDSRRRFFKTTTTAAVAIAAIDLSNRLSAAEDAADSKSKGNINHSVCKWCYPKISLEELCVAGKAFGLSSIDLLRPEQFATIKKHNLHCSMVSAPSVMGPEGKKVGGITNAWNRTENHEALVEVYERDIQAVSQAGYKHLICFSGNRKGMDDAEGLKNCAEGLKRIMRAAEKAGVVVTMELLNSKVNHKDYMADHTEWGVSLCEEIGSDNFKLLYDIYHMQIMEGDVIATIRRYHDFFSHYHTGGVPGRHEIDDTQELNYPAIMRAIVDTRFRGHVAQEFIPAKADKLASLKQAVAICDI